MNEELKKACELLRSYQAWRRGGKGEMPNPQEIGKALDLVLDYVENQNDWSNRWSKKWSNQMTVK